ncbi:MAG: outer membrane protein assembly factor BamA [Dysgonamonadaceae bacterium]|nr:outer membrane protein assembly factor BamA [Dysgonamonadaceae bacterium]
MLRNIIPFFILTIAVMALQAQDIASVDTVQTATIAGPVDTIKPPTISYSLTDNRRYAIADIKISGVESYNYEDYMLIGISGLTVGQRVSVPGPEITAAVRKFWKHGFFSDASILATRRTEDSVWLQIVLKPNPTVSEIRYTGVKKSEREDLETKIGMAKNSSLTPNLLRLARKRIKDYYDEKGFSNAEVTVRQTDDLSNPGKMILNIDVAKNTKTKIREIVINGNENLSYSELRMAMKKTNSGFSLRKDAWLNIRKIFSTKKYIEEEYRNDKENLIKKYNEKGYRDAEIVSDSVFPVDDKRVAIHLTVNEGNKYYIRNIVWVGNTLYPTVRTNGYDGLDDFLNMRPGDVYNQKKLEDRLKGDDDAVANLYYNNGYIFSQIYPVETYVGNDSIDLEIRIQEGGQATVNRVAINGNDRIYEDIIRRELLTKPGQLFSRELIMNTIREIAQSGHFDPENMNPDISPNQETGTVDISYNLTPKANDQVEFSAGYGQTGLIGRLSFKFSNFSFKNMIHPSTYKGVIPQGEGQTLVLSGQTNGRYYQSYSISFLEPWLGGKRPNSLSVSSYYMQTTGVDSRYYETMYLNPYLYQYGDQYGGVAYDENKWLRIFGSSVSFGKRLSWPDFYFNFATDLSYQRYMLRNWGGYGFGDMSDGNSNSVSLGLSLSRNSIDNPLYTRRGSQFLLSVNFTPPYSLWDGIDYEGLYNQARNATTTEELNLANGNRYNWVEYHKWKFKAKLFIPLERPERESVNDKTKRTPVLMNRIEYGFIGSYNSFKKTPFETFYMGGDGMTGYSTMYGQETIGLRGYSNGSLGYNGYAYTRLSMELRYPLLLEPSSTIYALAFVEAGNLWTNIRDFNPLSLKRSAGVGARIFLPMIGLMGVDWGYGFDRPTPSSAVSGGQFHFIIGQEF